MPEIDLGELSEIKIDNFQLTQLKAIYQILDASKSNLISCYDVRDIYDFVDFIFVCDGTSSTHIKSIVSILEKQLSQNNIKIKGKELSDNWSLLDLGSFVINVFNPQARNYYDLDGLYGF